MIREDIAALLELERKIQAKTSRLRNCISCVRGGCMACASHFYIRMRNYTWYADSGADRTRPAVVEKLWYNMRRFKEGNKTCLTQF